MSSTTPAAAPSEPPNHVAETLNFENIRGLELLNQLGPGDMKDAVVSCVLGIGIDSQVIAKDITRYLGPNSRVVEERLSPHDIRFWVSGARALSEHDILSLRDSTERYYSMRPDLIPSLEWQIQWAIDLDKERTSHHEPLQALEIYCSSSRHGWVQLSTVLDPENEVNWINEHTAQLLELPRENWESPYHPESSRKIVNMEWHSRNGVQTPTRSKFYIRKAGISDVVLGREFLFSPVSHTALRLPSSLPPLPPLPQEDPLVARFAKLKFSPKSSRIQEPLDSRYQVISQRAQRYFRVGRVFMTLQHAPARLDADGPNITTLANGEKVFSKPRPLVVVREGKGLATCCPIHTYGGQGAKKKGVASEEHAIIYAKSSTPPPHPEQPLFLAESPLYPIAFPVNLEDKSVTITSSARLNFGKVVTVEYDAKVRNMGKIDADFLENLKIAFAKAMGFEMPANFQAPISLIVKDTVKIEPETKEPVPPLPLANEQEYVVV